MAKLSDPHGFHDWSSKEYVRDWATRQDRYEEERKPQFQMIADAIPFTRDAAIRILDVGAGYGALAQFLLERFPNATAVCQDGSRLDSTTSAGPTAMNQSSTCGSKTTQAGGRYGTLLQSSERSFSPRNGDWRRGPPSRSWRLVASTASSGYE